LQHIYALPALPPSCGSYTFYEVNQSSAILHVLSNSKQYYQAATEWKDFSNIVEDAAR
jgi:hypothetical protein